MASYPETQESLESVIQACNDIRKMIDQSAVGPELARALERMSHDLDNVAWELVDYARMLNERGGEFLGRT